MFAKTLRWSLLQYVVLASNSHSCEGPRRVFPDHHLPTQLHPPTLSVSENQFPSYGLGNTLDTHAVPVHRALWHDITVMVDLDSSLPFVIQHRYAFLVFPSFVPPSVANRRRKLNQRIDFSTDEVAS